jgi:hypothetical protein
LWWGYSWIAGVAEAIPLAPVSIRRVRLPQRLPALPALPMKAIVIVEENSTRDSAHVGYNLILGRPTFSTLAGRSVSSVQKNMTAAVEMFKWGKSQGSSASACGGFRSLSLSA